MKIPSGKGPEDENFPVGSILIAAPLRPHVARFYAFARAADDIADDCDLPPEEKLRRLAGFEDALMGRTDDPAFAEAAALRESLVATGIGPQHGCDLISAFRQDARQSRYADWESLMGYCERSAAPVGRYLLDLHGEAAAHYPAADALCHALQVINHLQDCGDDLTTLDRCYLPTDWLVAEGAAVEDLRGPAATPALRRVFDRCLDATRDLLQAAGDLPRRLRSRRLAWESGVILHLAHRLERRLRVRDPLAERVVLPRSALVLAALGSAGPLLRSRP